ncbi:30S ribosomal protein S20 [Commensalibacter sp. Nvir]|uniref:30S ribosomal protein S20 n=1 Tax=Commensalibacter sp. Nvir TaxID=3069817 RepID=UPI002D282EA1|nr:30S ribosomal protein S20 [Commensalibacter sp. Nvir]
MANIASARKRIRQTLKRTERNKARRSRVRTFIKKVEEAVLAGNKEEANIAFKTAQPELQRACLKGVMHKNTVARKLSRLSQKIKKLASV